MKRIIKIITLLITVIGLVFCSNEATMVESDDSNFTNLIIFVRFVGWDKFIDNMYKGEVVRNNNTAAYNVGDYFRCVSDNKRRTRSVYHLIMEVRLSFRIIGDIMRSTVRQIKWDM